MIAHFNNRSHNAGLNLRRRRTAAFWVLSGSVILALASASVLAQPVLSPSTPAAPELPNSAAVVFSFLRVLGALAIVLGVFFGGIWCFRNWQRTATARGQAPKLNIFETKALGQRHALYVVGYEEQRLLIAASPAGVTMLTTLPPAALNATVATPAVRTNFSAALRQALQHKP